MSCSKILCPMNGNYEYVNKECNLTNCPYYTESVDFNKIIDVLADKIAEKVIGKIGYVESNEPSLSVRRCGLTWMLCDGNCDNCYKRTTTTTSTTAVD